MEYMKRTLVMAGGGTKGIYECGVIKALKELGKDQFDCVIGVSEELGGHVAVSVVVIIVTGVLGNIFAEKFLKLLRIQEPIAKGIAIGCSAHALGTAKAMEMGTIEGAMSSLSIVVCGVMTVVGASIFALFM